MCVAAAASEGQKVFFQKSFEKLQNDFSNFKMPSLAVSKFRNVQKKNFSKKSKTPRKKTVFKFSKTFIFVFKVQNDFYSFSSRFHQEYEFFFVFTNILFSKSNRFQMFQNDFFRFPAVFSMKTNIFLYSPKLCFKNLIVFKCFKMIFFRFPAIL